MFTTKKEAKLLIRKMLRRLPDKHYLYLVYLLTFGRRLNWKQPTHWTEKTQWKKFYDRRSLLTQVADKIELRKYAVDKLGADIMPKILWEGPSPDNIPYGILPDKFVIRTNHESGTNIINKIKNRFSLPLWVLLFSLIVSFFEYTYP